MMSNQFNLPVVSIFIQFNVIYLISTQKTEKIHSNFEIIKFPSVLLRKPFKNYPYSHFQKESNAYLE